MKDVYFCTLTGLTAQWFEIWFDTNYCDKLYSHRDQEEAKLFVSPLLGYLGLPAGAEVLDAACGRGRHAELIAENGYHVTGIDLSYRNIRQASCYENEFLSFFVHDMRLPFRINFFDAILNFYTSFAYFESEEDNLKTLRSFSAGLKNGGLLVIDFFNPSYVLKNMIAEENKTIEGIEFNISRKFEDGKILKRITVRDGDKEKNFFESVNCLLLSDFKSCFDSSGLLLKDVFGDYSLGRFDQQNSERMIMIAQK